MFLILLVLHDPDLCWEVVSAWEQAGATGITLLPSTGPGRIRRGAGPREDLPLIPSLADLLGEDEVRNQTLFTVVRDGTIKDKIIAETQHITGDLNQPNTGVLFVMPVAEAYGLDREA